MPQKVRRAGNITVNQLLLLVASACCAEQTKLSPIHKLIQNGFVYFDDVLSPEDVAAVRASAQRLLDNGQLRHLGQDGRDDHVAALAPGALQHDTEQYGDLVRAARVLMSLPSMLVQQGRTEGADQEHQETFERCSAPDKLMLACYPADGGRYVPHLDNDPDDPNHSVGTVGLRAIDRQYTAILYLNDGWQPADGGHLRLYKPSPSNEQAVVVDEGAAVHVTTAGTEGGWEDLEPKGGRLIIFDSKRILHEVRESYAPRWAISAWLTG